MPCTLTSATMALDAWYAASPVLLHSNRAAGPGDNTHQTCHRVTGPWNHTMHRQTRHIEFVLRTCNENDHCTLKIYEPPLNFIVGCRDSSMTPHCVHDTAVRGSSTLCTCQVADRHTCETCNRDVYSHIFGKGIIITRTTTICICRPLASSVPKGAARPGRRTCRQHAWLRRRIHNVAYCALCNTLLGERQSYR